MDPDQLIEAPSEEEAKTVVETKAPETEQKPEQKPETKQEPRPVERDRVPLATFLEEKRKFTEALDSERAERAKLQKEIEALKNPPKAPPDYATDPKGFIEHATKESAKEVLAKLDETKAGIDEVKKTTKETTERTEQQQFMAELAETEQAFIEKTPDYYDALGYVRAIAYAQLREMHPEATDDAIIKHIRMQEVAMAVNAKRAGRNPVELAYRMAVHNGYKVKEPVKESEGKETPKIEEDKKLAPDLTLGQSGGKDPDPNVDPETYDPFDEVMKEMFGRKRA